MRGLRLCSSAKTRPHGVLCAKNNFALRPRYIRSYGYYPNWGRDQYANIFRSLGMYNGTRQYGCRPYKTNWWSSRLYSWNRYGRSYLLSHTNTSTCFLLKNRYASRIAPPVLLL